MSVIRTSNRALSPRWLAVITLVTATGLGVPGCRRSAESPGPAGTSAKQPAATRKVVVYTTFYPTAYFTERIGADLVKVICPCPPNADPAWWMPDAETIMDFQRADLIVVNGASFEKWLDKVTLPESRLVDTTRTFADEFIVLEDTTTHSHGTGGTHTHEGLDGHTWLDPINARRQAEQIAHALIKQRPDARDLVAHRLANLSKDLDALDARLKSVSAKLQDVRLLASHPAYNYVGRRYGWKLHSFHLDPEKMPNEPALAAVKSYLAGHPARIMLWEAEPTKEVAAAFSQLGLSNVVYSPCEALDEGALAAGETFLSVMNGNLDRLAAALAQQ